MIEVELYINEETLVIQWSHDPTALSRTLDESFESRILNRLRESSEAADWTWLYYHLDDLVTEYRDGAMNIIRNDPR